MTRKPPLVPEPPLRDIPPLPALQAFERAAARLSFRLAARDLALSPSAISHQIRGLEERFGTKLFVREPRAIRLTPAGERYLAQVSAALATLADAGRELAQSKPAGGNELWVSSLPFFTSTVLMPALPAFARRHPELTLRIEATHQYADFDGSHVDVAVRYGRAYASGLRLEPLIGVSGLPVCAPAVAAGLRTPADLTGEVLLHLITRPQEWQTWLADVGLGDLSPRGHLWLDSMPAILDAAERGLGVALAMAPLIRRRDGFGSRLMAPFDIATPESGRFYLVSRPEQARDRRINALRRWITDAARGPQ
ncbi:LysR family transcriptional regulator [Bradyrhizobium sp. U87765 SZCCT0131]|uniref:LysR substrate-binding domain-containing protein n=1 Tax=unclassified Bradyrhizobium TaxID=2631580 RepID=UPI001BAAF4C6|nr:MULTISPECIES: LysR substrate-binding domain-containing protein [unclassified Bradyrhizobium]MBR1222784.1 LysR family transcriptional regulator [Bradyrhizobium sp. U87765 SZCCT0131]MBR1265135.1 LysR family transcriptional regulator [Bradyrhizobium sp. U87765 SZCCT0134]MBR1303086.1 LysR family transcriptional regulator [Bradyrhizobium sp. U87765 SZCCT0110]MBR1318692.1 LysR family transcriptional regulator [Bradyrhizobium sp. U87765 SZCCT0109]MBR1347015.1 LysR family transcriptional regulator 